MDDIVREARELYESDVSADAENRREAVTDLRFLVGDQWHSEIKAERERLGKPCMSFPRLNQYENWVTGNIRMNPPAIKVRPVDGSADPKVAELYTGLIRNIEAQSNGQRAYITAATNAVRGGWGWFGITYDYAPDSFEMELAFRRIPSLLAVVHDASAMEPTCSDMEHCFVTELIHRNRFEKLYPKASMAGFDSDNSWQNWREGDFVRVAEFWQRVPVEREIALLADGRMVDLGDVTDRSGLEIVRTRKDTTYRVEMRKLTGVEEIEDVHQWPGTMIPLVRVVGNEINIGDTVRRFGIIRQARDAQALYNIQRTAMAEAVAMAPKAKWVGTAKHFEGQERQWGAANHSNDAALIYTPDPMAPGGPQRVAPEMPSGALLADVEASAKDIEATIGIYRENLGAETNAESGKAILSRQRQGDTGTFLYTDNLADAVMQAGRILIDVLPKVYDTQRQVRVMGEDGKADFATLRQPVVDPATGMVTIINDLSVGRYDVVASVGPSYSTKREEERETLMMLIQAVPIIGEVAADVIVGAMDSPGAEEVHGRLRKMAIAKGYAKPGEGDEPPPPPQPSAEILLAQAEMAKAQAAASKAQAEAQIKLMELDIERGKLSLAQEELRIKAAQAGVSARNDTRRVEIEGVKAAAGVAGDMARFQHQRRQDATSRFDSLRARAEDRLMGSRPQG